MEILSPKQTIDILGTEEEFKEAHRTNDSEFNELLNEKIRMEWEDNLREDVEEVEDFN